MRRRGRALPPRRPRGSIRSHQPGHRSPSHVSSALLSQGGQVLDHLGRPHPVSGLQGQGGPSVKTLPNSGGPAPSFGLSGENRRSVQSRAGTTGIAEAGDERRRVVADRQAPSPRQPVTSSGGVDDERAWIIPSVPLTPTTRPPSTTGAAPAHGRCRVTPSSSARPSSMASGSERPAWNPARARPRHRHSGRSRPRPRCGPNGHHGGGAPRRGDPGRGRAGPRAARNRDEATPPGATQVGRSVRRGRRTGPPGHSGWRRRRRPDRRRRRRRRR